MVKQRVRTKKARLQALRPGSLHHRAKYSHGEVEITRTLRDEGWTYRAIAEKMEMPIRTVRDIVNFKRR